MHPCIHAAEVMQLRSADIQAPPLYTLPKVPSPNCSCSTMPLAKGALCLPPSRPSEPCMLSCAARYGWVHASMELRTKRIFSAWCNASSHDVCSYRQRQVMSRWSQHHVLIATCLHMRMRAEYTLKHVRFLLLKSTFLGQTQLQVVAGKHAA